jgi:hypothetical protein
VLQMLHPYTTTFPRSPSHNWAIYLIVGCTFLSPVDITPCSLLSVIVLHLFTPRDDLLKMCIRQDIASAQ